MKGSILYTKLQRPAVAPDIMPRDRLLDRLNAGLHRPLTLISAPAGYGKSTLASRWIAGCDAPNAWVSLEESDSDLHMFLSYVLAAIRRLFPGTEFRTEAILETSQMPPAADLARHLLNDLHQISEPFNLVLDDYHHIQRGSPVNDLLDEFLAHPPQGMHLVLLTRQDPSPPIATMRGRGLATEKHSQYFRLQRLLARLPEDAVAEAPLLVSTQAFIGINLGNDVDAHASTQRAIEMEISPESEAYSLRMRRINRKSVLIEILALLALVCHKQRAEAAALLNLQNALDLAESGNWIRTT